MCFISGPNEKEPAPYVSEGYSIAITCFLAFLAITPLIVVAVCCVCLRYRKKLKKLRVLELNHPAKFQLESGTLQEPIVAEVTHSTAQSNYAIPLTISTSPDDVASSTPPIRLRVVPAVFAGRDSIHQSLLFNDKLDQPPSSLSKFWPLSASYSCLSNTQLDNKDLSNSNLVDSTPRKSLITTSTTGYSDNGSSKVSTKIVPAQLTPCNVDSIESNLSSRLRKSESPDIKRSNDWKTRLRRSSTQPRTQHFFPQAWKTILSKSAKATTPTANQDEGCYFSQPKSRQSESSHQLIQAHDSPPIELSEAV